MSLEDWIWQPLSVLSTFRGEDSPCMGDVEIITPSGFRRKISGEVEVHDGTWGINEKIRRLMKAQGFTREQIDQAQEVNFQRTT